MILTRSVFYYGYDIDSTNRSLDFSEGGGELQATLNVGNYTATTILTEIKRAMEAIGALEYTVSMNRTTRVITIASTSNFELLCDTGSRVSSGVWSVIGFDATDRTGASTYAGDNATGSEFLPQMPLQSFVDADDQREFISPQVNESANADVELVKFGSKFIMEFEIVLQTDVPQPSGGYIDNDASGVSNLRAFMQFITEKKKFEFMPDRDTRTTFETYILESTPESRDGTAYRLKEQFAQNLRDYYNTGLLRFRRIT